MKRPELSPINRSDKSLFPYVFGLFFLLAFLDSWRRTGVRPFAFFEQAGREHLWKFVSAMFPPELSWTFLSLMLRPALETVQISVLGTCIAVAIGFPFGILGTRTLSVGGLRAAEPASVPAPTAAKNVASTSRSPSTVEIVIGVV